MHVCNNSFLTVFFNNLKKAGNSNLANIVSVSEIFFPFVNSPIGELANGSVLCLRNCRKVTSFNQTLDFDIAFTIFFNHLRV